MAHISTNNVTIERLRAARTPSSIGFFDAIRYEGTVNKWMINLSEKTMQLKNLWRIGVLSTIFLKQETVFGMRSVERCVLQSLQITFYPIGIFGDARVHSRISGLSAFISKGNDTDLNPSAVGPEH